MAAYRYWRIFSRSNWGTGGYFNTFSLEWRETIGGPQAATGGTPTASSSIGGSNGPDKAYDGSLSTYWESESGGAAVSQWIGYDLGAGNEKEFVELGLMNGPFSGENFKDILIQASNDNVSWDNLASVRVPQSMSGSYQDIAISKPTQTGRKYWRMRVVSVFSSSWMNITGFIVHPEADTDPQGLLNATSIIHPLATGNMDQRMITYGDVSSSFNAECLLSGETPPFYYGAIMPDGFLTKAYAISIKGGNYTSEQPKSVVFEYSDDGTTWTEALTVGDTGGTWVWEEIRTWVMADDGGGGGPPPGVPVGKKRRSNPNFYRSI